MRPLILDFKTARLEDENPISYTYDPYHSLNVITVNGQTKPFIDMESADVELMTKTPRCRKRSACGLHA